MCCGSEECHIAKCGMTDSNGNCNITVNLNIKHQKDDDQALKNTVKSYLCKMEYVC